MKKTRLKRRAEPIDLGASAFCNHCGSRYCFCIERVPGGWNPDHTEYLIEFDDEIEELMFKAGYAIVESRRKNPDVAAKV